MRYLVQRSFDGRCWATRTGSDDKGEAATLADHGANNAEKGVSFRVIDSATGEETFRVENPSR